MAQSAEGSVIRTYDFSGRKPEGIELPKKLREISGLTVTGDDRLFGHDDERGIIYEIDAEKGDIVKRFYFGHLVKKADFEGLDWAGGTFYLLTSNGQIIVLNEGLDRESVRYTVHSTDLDRKHNLEGLCFDPVSNSLLLACKEFPGEGYEGFRAVYSFRLSDKSIEPEPRFLIHIETVSELLSIDDFQPSGMARHPRSGTFFIISANDPAVIELSEEGKILGLSRLDDDRHRQPEGIAIRSDGSVLIADEGKKHGMLSIYKAGK